MSSEFHKLKVADIRQEIADAVSIRFEVPSELQQEFCFTPGQHLTIRSLIDGADVRRNYSICASPGERELRVAIKRVAGGVFSNWANEMLAVGQELDVLPPHGSFTWTFEESREALYVGFAGGSGITPVLSLMKTALEQEPRSKFVLCYGNRSSQSIMFMEEIANLKNRYLDRLIIQHFLEDESGDFPLLNGRLDQPKMRDLLATFGDVTAFDAAFICGPGPMMNAVEAELLTAGMEQGRILTERFTADELSEDQMNAMRELEKQAEGRAIKVNIDGRRRTFNFSADRGSILENARAEGIRAPFACKAGVCATCRAKVISGKVEMAKNFGLTDDEVTQGFVLTCQSVPLTDDVELDFDQ